MNKIKAQEYIQTVQVVTTQFSRENTKWAAFLKTASRMYKYPYTDQLMIYVQRPDATACASIDLWNRRLGRWVKRGSKGIALLDFSGKQPRLRYVFDISDTFVQKSAETIYKWEVKQEYEKSVLINLAAKHDVQAVSLPVLLNKIAEKLTADFCRKHEEKILSYITGSSVANCESFQKAAAVSTAYVLMSRCGIDPAEYLNENDLNVCTFNTTKSVDALGRAVADISAQTLRKIEEIVKECESKKSELLAEPSLNEPIIDTAAEELVQKAEAETKNKPTSLPVKKATVIPIQLSPQNANLEETGEPESIPAESLAEVQDEAKPENEVIRQLLKVSDKIILAGIPAPTEKSVQQPEAKPPIEKKSEVVPIPLSPESAKPEEASESAYILAEPLAEIQDEAKPENEVIRLRSEIIDNTISEETPAPTEKSVRQPTAKTHIEKKPAVLIDLFQSLELDVTTEQQTVSPTSLLRNYRITDDQLGEGGAKTKYGYNIAAIRALKTIETENRAATPDEQEVLAKYVGWGGLSQAFDADNTNWKREYAELKELLTDAEFVCARASTLTAFYTPPIVIRAMYQTVEKLGFRQGKILEPSCAVGNFFGMLPDSMAESKLYGVEVDSLSGRIAQKLYPNAAIYIKGFEDTTFADNSFDLVIGNVPFGNFAVADRKYDKYKFNIHEYFFAKSLDKLRPGGIAALVVSKWLMDKKDTTKRQYFAERAELIGAIRLPETVCLQSAGTETTMDILFLQKRDKPGEAEFAWLELGMTQDGVTVNRYFAEHQEMICGEMVQEDSRFGKQDSTTCKPLPDTSLKDLSQKATLNIHGEYKIASDVPVVEESVAFEDMEGKNYSYHIKNGEVYYKENDAMLKQPRSTAMTERIKRLIELRDCVRYLIKLQLEDYDDDTIRTWQTKLNRLYDRFTATFGLINSRSNKLAFADDSSYYLLCSLEILDEDGNLERKADMFSKRTIKQAKTVTAVDTPSEALAVSIGERGCVDIGFMASLLQSTDIESMIENLKGVIYKDPTAGENPYTGWQTAEEYLSGNVRDKLRIAQAVAETNPLYEANVAALTSAQPQDLEAAEITVRLGATWIGKDYVEQFVYELLQTPEHLKDLIHVNYSPLTSIWSISSKRAVNSNDVLAYTTYGTERANAYRIIEDSLNLRDVRIYDTILDEEGKEKRVLNKEQTTLAAQKQDAIKQQFKEWIFSDAERRQALVAFYNENFNSTLPREYDGSHIRFHGMNPAITLRTHQLNAIARILYGGNTLLAHVVGAGKTFEMVAAAMESKYLGLCAKSLFVVPNHLTEQWGAEFLRLYPAANILVTTKKDFERANRKKFCARITTGAYDAIIIGHSQFEKVPISKERQERLLNEQIEEITDGIQELQSQDGERFTIKQLERTRKNLEARLERLVETGRKDDVITFEELGVDRIFVDEAHSYKNLFLFTKMRNVAGLSTSDAQKSSDMFLKCRYLDEITEGKGIIFATGTPVSNSMTELYTIQRYLQFKLLEQKGLVHFDCWASTFTETVTAIELAPEGSGYRARTRFARFFNLPELMNMFKNVADIKTADMINLPTPEAQYETIVAQPTEHQKEVIKTLSERAKRIHTGSVDPRVDNLLKITSDGRKLGLEQRLINPLLPDAPGSKINQCVQNVFRIWQEGAAEKLTQLIFCDISTPKKDEFNVYDTIREKLLTQGVPEAEIAYIHEANTDTQKKELFAKVRTGKVRVLLGSTQKMGAGTNVQNRLIAIHDVDCPWRPGDLEQRSGRIKRQGNQNEKVYIFRYVTEGTFDAYLYQTIENKQRFISQIMTSKSPVRSCEDVDETALSYAEIKALCAGNPLIKEKMDLDVEVARLKLLKTDFQNHKYKLEDRLLKYYPERIRKYEQYATALKTDLATLNAHPLSQGAFAATIKNMHFAKRTEAGAALIAICNDFLSDSDVEVGSYRGFSLHLRFDRLQKEFKVIIKGATTREITMGLDASGNMIRIENALDNLPKELTATQNELDNLYQQVENAKIEVKKSFSQEEELKTKSARLVELNTALDMDKGFSESAMMADEEPAA